MRASSDPLFLIDSGSNPIESDRILNHRLIQIALALRERGAFVYFLFERHSFLNIIPHATYPRLFQQPRDWPEPDPSAFIREDFGGRDRTLVVGAPDKKGLNLARECHEQGWRVIYDCYDEWEEFHRVGKAPNYDLAAEKKLVTLADTVTVSSTYLKNKMASWSPDPNRVRLSRNAWDVNFGQAPGNRPRSRTVGYVGTLFPHWFDWDGLKKVALLRPHYRFEVGGYPRPECSIPPNVHLLGPLTRPEILEAARNWNVGMIPFRMNALCDAVDPLKIYEYLALGIPCVSFFLPEIEPYPETFLARTPQEFAAHLDRAMDKPFDHERVKTFLENNTWSQRTTDFFPPPSL